MLHSTHCLLSISLRDTSHLQHSQFLPASSTATHPRSCACFILHRPAISTRSQPGPVCWRRRGWIEGEDKTRRTRLGGQDPEDKVPARCPDCCTKRDPVYLASKDPHQDFSKCSSSPLPDLDGSHPILRPTGGSAHSLLLPRPLLSRQFDNQSLVIPCSTRMSPTSRSASNGNSGANANANANSSGSGSGSGNTHTSNATVTSSARATKKSAFSCEPCRRRKVKCGGEQPICSRCLARNDACVYKL